MREEKYYCPNYCITKDEAGECPECGRPLEKIKGDDYMAMSSSEDDDTPPMTESIDDFDPDEISWYNDGEESLGTM